MSNTPDAANRFHAMRQGFAHGATGRAPSLVHLEHPTLHEYYERGLAVGRNARSSALVRFHEETGYDPLVSILRTEVGTSGKHADVILKDEMVNQNVAR